LPKDKELSLIKTVFVDNPTGLSKLSVGHRKVAQDMQPKFAKLESYYTNVVGGPVDRLQARIIKGTMNFSIPENYSPTSYLINTLLPPDNENRTMDYVATIVINN
jgi:hypothetical protein